MHAFELKHAPLCDVKEGEVARKLHFTVRSSGPQSAPTPDDQGLDKGVIARGKFVVAVVGVS